MSNSLLYTSAVFAEQEEWVWTKEKIIFLMVMTD